MKRPKNFINLGDGVADAISDLKKKKKSGKTDFEMKMAVDSIDIVNNIIDSISKGSQVDLFYFNIYSKSMQRLLKKGLVKNGVRLQKEKAKQSNAEEVGNDKNIISEKTNNTDINPEEDK